MTNHTIPADKIREVIAGLRDDEYDARDALEALIPAPPTIADELRDMAEKDAWANPTRLRTLADRVEDLEKERDDAAKSWRHCGEELAEARAEINRLKSRELPDGWRIAEHPFQGTVIAAERLDGRGDQHWVALYDGPGDPIRRTWGNPTELSFRDESPEPEETPEPGHPTHLETLEDYQNAPTGTIVQVGIPGVAHFTKGEDGYWTINGVNGYYMSETMSGLRCEVREWGTGPEVTQTETAVIRDPEDLDQHDMDALLLATNGDYLTVGDLVAQFHDDPEFASFPAVVIATAEQVRAAQEALEDAR